MMVDDPTDTLLKQGCLIFRLDCTKSIYIGLRYKIHLYTAHHNARCVDVYDSLNAHSKAIRTCWDLRVVYSVRFDTNSAGRGPRLTLMRLDESLPKLRL